MKTQCSNEKYIPDAGKVKAKRAKKAGKGENAPKNAFFRTKSGIILKT